MAEEKKATCSGCGRKIDDVNVGASKKINGKWFCSMQCHKKHAQ